MYYSFSRLVNATNPKTAFNKINTFEEYTLFLEKPVITIKCEKPTPLGVG